MPGQRRDRYLLMRGKKIMNENDFTLTTRLVDTAPAAGSGYLSGDCTDDGCVVTPGNGIGG